MGMRLAGPVVSRLEIMEARRQAVALQHSEEAAPVLAGGDTEEDLGVDQGIEHLEGAGKQRLVMLRRGLQGEEGGAVVLDIGRASCRERVCQYVSIPVVAV